MPEVVAVSGAAPHYTPPRLDGGRPGTYWFNTKRPTAGTGWDTEVVAFHEAVPGHHLQLSRLQLLTELPALQRQRSLPVFAEGWGLYAEQLAEEAGLYADERSLLGAISTSLMRAARLVVDTGMHTGRMTPDEAREYFQMSTFLDRKAAAAEIQRYIDWPGQALAYYSGKRKILEIRSECQGILGKDFDLRGFHSKMLSLGSVPMSEVRTAMVQWANRRKGQMAKKQINQTLRNRKWAARQKPRRRVAAARPRSRTMRPSERVKLGRPRMQ